MTTENIPTPEPVTRVPDQAEFDARTHEQPSQAPQPSQTPQIIQDGQAARVEPAGEIAPVEEAQAERPDDQRVPAPALDTIPSIPVAAADAPIMEDYRASVAEIEAAHPELQGTASALWEFIGTRAAADLAQQGPGQYETRGPNLRDPDVTRQHLRLQLGDIANTVMDTAAVEFKKLPPSVQAWITQDLDGSGATLANHPDLILALSLRPFAALSPAAATRELQSVRQSKAYQQGDRLAVAKAHLLGIVAGRAGSRSAGSSSQESRALGSHGGDDVAPGQGSAASVALRRELDQLQRDPKSDLYSLDSERRRRAVTRRAEIVAQLGDDK